MSLSRIIEVLDAKPCGNGWSARCPAHDDRSPSLSIGVGEGRRVLLHCHAGCTPESIVASIGMTLADLFDDESPRAPARRARSSARTYTTAKDAIEAVSIRPRKDGFTFAKSWIYQDADGQDVLVAVRY